MYISVNNENIIKAVSNDAIKSSNMRVIQTEELNGLNHYDILGKQLVLGSLSDPSKLKVAIICNWKDTCGIATYTNYLVNSLKNKVGEIKIFAEHITNNTEDG